MYFTYIYSSIVKYCLVNACVVSSLGSYKNLSEMAKRVKAFATKPDDLSSIPGIHRLKERTHSCKLSSGLDTMYTWMYT